LRAEMACLIARRGISEAAWVEEAVREKLAAEAQVEFLEKRAAKGDRSAFERVLARVPDADPMPGDAQ